MKICHSISSIDKNSGGTSSYMQLLANSLVMHTSISIAALRTNNPLQLNGNVNLYLANPSFLQINTYSTDLKKYLNQIETDLYHGNGLWQFPVHAMCQAALKRNIPYIISPHGMLEPWALNTHKLKKKLGLWFFQYNDLANANCIHATAKAEAEHIRKLGLKNPIAVIPNGIDLSEFPIPDSKQYKEQQTLLFLSRIHPKKGIELLIEAWSKLDITLKQNWKVQIAGNGESNYIASLQHLIETKKLTEEISLIGPLFGTEKLKAYQQADLFVLPTYSENFGIVVAEALACGVPVITTKGTPWEELNAHNAGWWIDIGIEPLTQTLQKALHLTASERQLMGKNGRKLVEENYSIEAISKKMIELYNYVLCKTERPTFIQHIETNKSKAKSNLISDSSGKIQVNHVISSIDVFSGGPSYSVTQLSNRINISGFQSTISTFSSDNPLANIEIDNNIYSIKDNSLKYFKLNNFLSYLIDTEKINILHGHGIWQLPIHQMAKIASQKDIPYLISPRGMLEPWALNAGKWKKKLALALYQRKDLENAACIHATGPMEAEHIRKLGFENPIAVIPNGIDLSKFPAVIKEQPLKKRTVLFLSRIHQKKGIEFLIEAWFKLDKSLRQNWQIEIAGNGATNYIETLQQLITIKGLEKEITLIGPQFGDNKLKAYHRADLFVLPTYSENFGIVVAEALACGVPVITTNGTPWEKLNTCNAGWWIEVGIAPLFQALQQALQLNYDELQLKGQNGRKLVEENYSIESVASKMIQLYKWVLKNEKKPDFIY